jgi:hypothetical protein
MIPTHLDVPEIAIYMAANAVDARRSLPNA